MAESFDHLLDRLPGLRRLRALDAEMLRLLFDRREKECTWCGNRIPKGRRAWCSAACVESFKRRCDPNHQRQLVEARDRGICQACGRDTLAAVREAERRGLTGIVYREPGMTDAEYLEAQEREHAALRQLGFARGRWREVDHTTPVCQGGGLCGIEGARLLCGTCHLNECNRLARMRQTSGEPTC